MATERINSHVQQERLPEDPTFLYSKIEDRRLRVLLRAGDAVTIAAAIMGVDLATRREDKGDDWFDLLPDGVMERLTMHGQQTARKVLKEARRQVNQGNLNGDRREVLDQISALMKTLGKRQNNTFVLPPLPPKRIAISPLKV